MGRVITYGWSGEMHEAAAAQRPHLHGTHSPRRLPPSLPGRGRGGARAERPRARQPRDGGHMADGQPVQRQHAAQQQLLLQVRMQHLCTALDGSR
jgi:hypothetical protein